MCLQKTETLDSLTAAAQSSYSSSSSALDVIQAFSEAARRLYANTGWFSNGRVILFVRTALRVLSSEDGKGAGRASRCAAAGAIRSLHLDIPFQHEEEKCLNKSEFIELT